MTKKSLSLSMLMLLASACGHKAPAAADQAAAGNTTATVAPAAPAIPVEAPTAKFSIDQVPVSNAPLGKFPFFGLPPGYQPQNTPKPAGFGHFPFWTGKAFEDVEGETYMVTIVGTEEKEFFSYALKKNLETLFQQAGAVKISDAKIPTEALDAIPSTTRQELSMGMGDVWNDPAQTWVIRRPQDVIWIHYTTNTAQGSLAVVQSKAFVATAALLPAEQLRSDLDKTGKAVIHLNFATDQTQILPTSKDQLDAVIALLKANPALKLAINGYTDDAGSDSHNITLSDGRAKEVRNALLANGIKTDRLQAKGFGRANPVSSNVDEAGKAANRRVELIKLS